MTAIMAVSAMISDHPATARQLVASILASLSTDIVPNVRFNVAKTLKKIGTGPDALAILRPLVNDNDPDVKFYARDAIEVITKKH